MGDIPDYSPDDKQAKAEIMRKMQDFRAVTENMHPILAVSAAINFVANVIVTHTVMSGAPKAAADDWCNVACDTMCSLVDKNFEQVRQHHLKWKAKNGE